MHLTYLQPVSCIFTFWVSSGLTTGTSCSLPKARCRYTFLPSWVSSGLTWRATVMVGFPTGSDGKDSACDVGDLGSIPGLGRSPGGGHGNPLQSSCLENPHGQRSLVGYSPRGSQRVGHDWGTKHNHCRLWHPLLTDVAGNILFLKVNQLAFHPFFFFLLLGFFFICSEFCHTLKWKGLGFTCLPHPPFLSTQVLLELEDPEQETVLISWLYPSLHFSCFPPSSETSSSWVHRPPELTVPMIQRQTRSGTYSISKCPGDGPN